MEGQTLERLRLRDNPLAQGLILVTLALVCLGVVMVYSTFGTVATQGPWYDRRDARQVMYAVAGMLLLCTLWRMDYRWLGRRPWPDRRGLGWVPAPAWFLLAVTVVLAAIVLAAGESVRGTRRFLQLGPVSFQPSEALKFAVLIALAAYLSRPGARPGSLRRTLLPAGALVVLAVGLVVTENFGTAAIIAFAAGGLLLMAGMPFYKLLLLVPPAAAGFYAFVVRDPDRWARMDALLHLHNTANPSAYQPMQSLIAIAAGIEPAGLGAGPAKYGYLPDSSTDFVFSVICHEMGILGAVLVIGLVLAWLVLVRRVVRDAPDRFGALLAGGLGFLICLQAAMHIAVAVVWMPPTGVTLPFVSAGGTALVAMSVAAGLIVSVSARRRAGAGV
jgi:cell division protein FtsW